MDNSDHNSFLLIFHFLIDIFDFNCLRCCHCVASISKKILIYLKIHLQPSTEYVSLSDAQLKEFVSDMKDDVLSVLLPDNLCCLSKTETVSQTLEFLRRSEFTAE